MPGLGLNPGTRARTVAGKAAGAKAARQSQATGTPTPTGGSGVISNARNCASSARAGA